ncbi:hypothetical protein BO79DRAFT_219755 [Aspergillus costaricaensis CBS 115574]|uniref:Uncharacterized protein n=1 Tax=Aspergillus costaricaensis CBS 115574 TaxID=1448317 RepID=A0ACD1I7U0_9EURO|nr:hypothetical protein BO79DRAFT_219755 [Aspergillus costaricaensis CBS 115574]RAK86414.1 hypothetical protein BO79DRAFT_219755 [Aspergillus costaricaensis CBS 115574]
MSIFLITTLLSTTVQALTTFDTNCTIPSDQVNYVSSPNTRGTLTILWACLFTILSCTWTVQNLDKYTTQAVWFVVTVLAPEVLLGKYWLDNKKADEELSDLQKYAQEDGVEWTKTHSLFANMGGFAIRINLAQRRPEALVSPEPENKAENGTNCEEEHPNSRPASGSEERRSPANHATDEESGVSSLRQEKYTYFLSAPKILSLRAGGGLSRMPDITKEKLPDRSKADGLMRLITVVQIMWMCIQVITRAVRGLTVSQLEISVTAFASCAVVMYWLSWDKPKGVMVPITIVQYGDEGRALSLIMDKAGGSGCMNYLASRYARYLGSTSI